MSILTKTLPAVLMLSMVVGATAQTLAEKPLSNNAGSVWANSGVDAAQGCQEGDTYVLEVPNLICADLGRPGFVFRPEVINLDALTIRDVLEAAGTDIECEGHTLLVQAVRFEKKTPYWKCTAFVMGPGSGLNTNFDTGWKYADSTMLNDPVLNRAFGIPSSQPALGNRALLFSPPNTKYTIKVAYVRRDNSTGRTGTPVIAEYCVQVKIPTRADIYCVVDYFSTVAAGVTQKPKITEGVKIGLGEALSNPDNLEALIMVEYIVAMTTIDFAVLRDAKPAGKYDARWYDGYLIDTDEEPIACLLLEMAAAALWY